MLRPLLALRALYLSGIFVIANLIRNYKQVSVEFMNKIVTVFKYIPLDTCLIKYCSTLTIFYIVQKLNTVCSF